MKKFTLFIPLSILSSFSYGQSDTYKYKLDFFGDTVLVDRNDKTTLAQTQVKSKEKVYTNPLKVQLGDPFILFTEGTYYMYGTGKMSERGFSAYSSKDLVNWKPEGQVYHHNNKNGWSDPNTAWDGAYWAPEVYKVKGKYYLFTVHNGR